MVKPGFIGYILILKPVYQSQLKICPSPIRPQNYHNQIGARNKSRARQRSENRSDPSECDLMKKGDYIYMKGPMIDKEKSDNICVTALTGIYPWVMTARFGVESKNSVS